MIILTVLTVMYVLGTLVAFGVGYTGWWVNRGLYHDEATSSARIARHCYLWPFLILGKIKEMLEDAK